MLRVEDRGLYEKSASCVRAHGLQWFKLDSGVCQRCVLATDSFATSVDLAPRKNTGIKPNWSIVWSELQLLRSQLCWQRLHAGWTPWASWSSTGSNGNRGCFCWARSELAEDKSRFKLWPVKTTSLLSSQGQDIVVVESLSWCLIQSSTRSSPDILRHSVFTKVYQHSHVSLDNQIWKLCISTATKLKLNNSCILAIFLYCS